MALEPTTWDALRQLRLGGQKPALPVIVTTKKHLARALDGVGCMVIVHEAGTVMPVTLLDGLDLIFYFDTCALAETVWRLAKSKGVELASARAYCGCTGITTIAPMSCESHEAAMEWLGIE